MTKANQMTNVQAPMTKKMQVPGFLNSLVIGIWSLVICLSEAFLGDFGFADGSGGVVDEVVDLVQPAEEHGMAVDHDLVELGVVDRAGEGGEAGGLFADALDDDFDPLAAIRLFAGDAAGGGGFFGGFFLGHGRGLGAARGGASR